MVAYDPSKVEIWVRIPALALVSELNGKYPNFKSIPVPFEDVV